MTRKRRTRQHVIEEMGVNLLERQVLRRAYQLQRPSLGEYGWDAAMFHFSPDGQIENGEVRFQVKATNNLNIADVTIRCRVETADLHYWYWDEFPFVLVVYDARVALPAQFTASTRSNRRGKLRSLDHRQWRCRRKRAGLATQLGLVHRLSWLKRR